MPGTLSSLDRFGAGAGAGESPELSTNMSLWLSNSLKRFLLIGWVVFVSLATFSLSMKSLRSHNYFK